MNKEITIFWFRRDLRLEDNIGLYSALKSENPVLCIFIFDTEILSKLTNDSDQRVQFIYKTLLQLKEKLKSYGSDLHIIFNSPKQAWMDLLKDFSIQKVFSNEDYEPYAIQRDKDILSLLETKNIEFNQFKDQCIFSKKDILKANLTPYTVFTPYKNKWKEKLQPKDIASVELKNLHHNFLNISFSEMITLEEMGFKNTGFENQTNSIKKKLIEEYHLTRDIPSLDATSKLSLHLRFGTLSIRKAVRIAMELNQTWLDELIWREFFMQILFHFPHATNQAFKEKYNKIQWRNNQDEFQAWCEGRTGYPLVDAGMRELNQTGFMHNRVRMVTASFLVKHLLVDWRWGEAYFAEKLLDYELSANNGNWQWVAGTGCDAAPYFRIFNPETQRKRFDPNDLYIKKWIPEFGTKDYPNPIVEHKKAYQRALITYKKYVG